MIEAALRILITTGVPALTRFYPALAAQQVEPPFAVQQRIGTSVIRSLAGPSGLTQARVQIDVYSLGYDEARDLALAVRGVLDGYAGDVSVPVSPAESVAIRACSFQEERDFVVDVTTPILYRRSADFLIMFEE